ncbi:LysR family transcriptional regulator [Neisseriaceae bacterium TC5R-5]|nr:LysR family transcriptional regulator [Neisseriaceae bacterium TC5R-5]
MNTAIDLRQFRYFLTVSEELNIGRAAKQLNISQPPLSRQIQLLEEQLGVALFTRSKTGVMLTAAGQALVPEAKKTLVQAEKAIAAARAQRALNCGLFVLGYTTVFDRSAIPFHYLETLRADFPGWQFVNKGNYSIKLIRDIKNGVVDAAFIGLHSDAQGLSVETIQQEPFFVALAAKHPLAGKRKLGLNELNDESLFWFERRVNPGFYDYCEAFFKQVDFRPKRLPEPSDHHMTLGLIAEGVGFALVPASLCKIKRDGVVFRALTEKYATLSVGIAIAYSKQNPSPVLQRLLQEIQAAPRPSRKI